MAYLLGQILFCLFFAAMTGFAVGWLFRGAQPSAAQQVPLDRLDEAATAPAAHQTGNGEDNAAILAENEQLRARLETGMGRLRQIEQNLSAQASTAAEQVAVERERADSLQASLQNTQTALAERARALASRDALLGKQSETLQSLERRLSSNAEVIKSANALTERHQAQAFSAASAGKIGETLQAMDTRLRDFDSECSKHDQKIDRLGKNIAAVAEQAVSMRTQVTGARQRLAEAQARTDPALATRLASAREQLSKMQNQVLERDQLIAQLRERLKAPSTAVQQELPITRADPGAKPQWLLDQPNGRRDDLKRVYGIGPVLERTLNELGLFHFRQIAELSATDVAWLAAHINSFPDRIIRDRWVEQARDLVAQG